MVDLMSLLSDALVQECEENGEKVLKELSVEGNL